MLWNQLSMSRNSFIKFKLCWSSSSLFCWHVGREDLLCLNLSLNWFVWFWQRFQIQSAGFWSHCFKCLHLDLSSTETVPPFHLLHTAWLYNPKYWCWKCYSPPLHFLLLLCAFYPSVSQPYKTVLLLSLLSFLHPIFLIVDFMFLTLQWCFSNFLCFRRQFGFCFCFCRLWIGWINWSRSICPKNFWHQRLRLRLRLRSRLRLRLSRSGGCLTGSDTFIVWVSSGMGNIRWWPFCWCNLVSIISDGHAQTPMFGFFFGKLTSCMHCLGNHEVGAKDLDGGHILDPFWSWPLFGHCCLRLRLELQSTYFVVFSNRLIGVVQLIHLLGGWILMVTKVVGCCFHPQRIFCAHCLPLNKHVSVSIRT